MSEESYFTRGAAKKDKYGAGSGEGCRPGAEPQEPQLAATGGSMAVPMLRGTMRHDSWLWQLRQAAVTANLPRHLIHSCLTSSFIHFNYSLEYPWCARYRSSFKDGLVSKVDRFLSSGVATLYFIDFKLYPFIHYFFFFFWSSFPFSFFLHILTSWQSECILDRWRAIVSFN